MTLSSAYALDGDNSWRPQAANGENQPAVHATVFQPKEDESYENAEDLERAL